MNESAQDWVRSFLEDSPDSWGDPLLQGCRQAAQMPTPALPSLPQALQTSLQGMSQTYAASSASGVSVSAGASSSASGGLTSAVAAKLGGSLLAAKMGLSVLLAGAAGASYYFYLNTSPSSETREALGSHKDAKTTPPPIDRSKEFASEKELRSYYGHLSRVTLRDGRVFVGRVEFQSDDSVWIHSIYGVIEVPKEALAKLENEKEHKDRTE